MRGFLQRAAAAFMVAVLCTVTTLSAYVYAADASWSNGSIVYEGNTYSGPADASMVERLNLLQDTQVFTYLEPMASSGAVRTLHVIFFAPDVDLTNAANAKYQTFNAPGNNTYNSPSALASISVDQQEPNSSSDPNEETTSCAVEGVGWIVCSLSNFLASSMDWVFGVLTEFLEVRPIDPSPDTALRRAWSTTRNIANIAFVIGFLIIIYSQVTTLGLNNYGIKKILPRLIVAALLVNLSFIICSLAVDVSNVLGYGIQQLFLDMRNGLVGLEGNSWQILSFSSVTSFVLAGGTAAVTGGIALLGVVASQGVVGAIALLLPMLVTGLLAILVAFLIMAARQALITVLIIIAPLAFVAYLLPNTEKWFDKWRSTFTTMLVLFPAFSVIFGGSQLAGAAIIQNANSINVLLLGMFVQVMPLVITPMLIKLSGSIVGRVAGMVNNPNKGLIDRTRNFTKDRAENREKRRLGDPAPRGARGALRRYAQRKDYERRVRENRRKTHETMADARWSNSQAFSDIDQQMREATDHKTIGEGRSELRYVQSKGVAGSQRQALDYQMRSVQLDTENAKVETDNNWERNRTPVVAEAKLRQRVLKDINAHIKAQDDSEYEIQKSAAYQATAEYGNLSAVSRTLVDTARVTSEHLAIQGMRNQSAKRVQQEELARALEASREMREMAGASIIDPYGAGRAEASAISTITKAETEIINNNITRLTREAQNRNETLNVRSRTILQETIAGTVVHDQDTIEAALEAQAQEGQVANLEMARGSTNIDQGALTRVLARNSSTMKAKGGFHLQFDPRLNINEFASEEEFLDALNKQRLGTLGDTSAQDIGGLKIGWLVQMAQMLDNDADGIISSNINNVPQRQAMQQALDNFILALESPEIRGKIGDRINLVENVIDVLQRNGLRRSPPHNNG